MRELELENMNMLQEQIEDDSEIEEEIPKEQYLTFILAGEEYGVEILKVQEIKGWDKATPLPNAPEYILGVLNLRGAIVPVMDVRKRFELESVEYTVKTVAIMVNMVQGGTERVVGLVVDAVADVHELDINKIQLAPKSGSTHTEYVKGLASIGDNMVILLDVDNLLDFSSSGNKSDF